MLTRTSRPVDVLAPGDRVQVQRHVVDVRVGGELDRVHAIVAAAGGVRAVLVALAKVPDQIGLGETPEWFTTVRSR
jgi:hypothetical protein